VEHLHETVFLGHDLRLIALAIGICALGSLTGVAVGQHALKPETKKSRDGWLLLASLVTGLSIWATHFTAMVGYREDLHIRFDIMFAAISLLLAIIVSTIGWFTGFRAKPRPILSGIIIGGGVVAAHLADMQALRFSGHMAHDEFIVVSAVAACVLFGALSGYLFGRLADRIFAWPAAIATFTSVTSLHFISMAGVTIAPSKEVYEAMALTADPGQIATVVVALFLALLTIAIAFTWHSESLARATKQEHQKLLAAIKDLRRTQEHHRAYVELGSQIAWTADPLGRVTEMAPLWEELVGVPTDEGLGTGWTCVIHSDDRAGVVAAWNEVVAAGGDRRADLRQRMRMVDGSYRWFRVRARARLDCEGRVLAWYGSLEDIHEQVVAELALRASEERYRFASVATNDVIWDWWLPDRRGTWGGAHSEILGYANLDNVTEISWWKERVHPDDLPRVLASYEAALESGAETWSEEYRFRVASGAWKDFKSRGIVVRNDEGEAVRLIGTMLDITEQKRAQAELNWTAYHDPLTKLPNRALYAVRMQAAIEAAAEADHYVALIIVDLNNFKELNDTLGHAAGDAVLAEVAARLLRMLPRSTTVARLGGDEFAIIVPALSVIEHYKDVTRALSTSFEEPVLYGELRIPVSHGAGVALWPRDASDPGELLIAADLALYASKAEMPGTIGEFVPSMKDASERRSRMLVVAREGLNEDRIVPFYQPKIDLQTGEVMGWEALLRVEKDGHFLAPSEISAAFSDAELSVQLTDRMIARAFEDLARWRAAGLQPGRIALNASAGDFRSRDLAGRLQRHAEANGQGLDQIDIEVTETVLIGQLGPEVARMLEELRALGLQVALDDFGTGYASLTHLQQFPVDVIKIDKSFIDRIDHRAPQGTVVIDAVLQMARRLGMQSVAEGIETIGQARYLRARGCTIGQGYLFSRPVPADQVVEILTNNSFAHWEFGIA
jgi:diguanylate cyclase (GGDEF)-like protein/PAS domain S-box-containing protein